MSLYRTLNPGEEAGFPSPGSSPAPSPRPGAPGATWLDRILPAPGFERAAFLLLALAVVALKILAIYHFRADSDETQHAHVVWGWANGKLQYRDLFDNHMPLFQMAMGPYMALLGERADILIPLRWAMLPLYFLSLWAVFRLTAILYSQRAAPWAALCAAALPKFFFTSTEFRTDDLWATFWLISLLVAVSGAFDLKRAFAFGLMLGLAFAVSMKTVVLVVALGAAYILATLIAWLRGFRPSLSGSLTRITAILAGAIIAPAAVIYYFARQGAYWIMRYCVIDHNIVPGLKRWGHFTINQWYFPAGLVVLGLYGWLICRQAPNSRIAIRRVIIALTPWLFLCLLLSYWPDITREDDLPYVPLIPISLIPLLILAAPLVRSESMRRNLWTFGLPAVVACELFWVTRFHNIGEDRLRTTTRHIADVLALTHPGDYIMDEKGDYVFRPRPYYWVLEPITKARVRDGLIHDNIPLRLTEKSAKICYLYCAHAGSIAAQFIVNNYVPFDKEALDIGVLGKVISIDPAASDAHFNIAIPQQYTFLTETGRLAGDLDGKPYNGPVWLAAGPHQFHRTQGAGRMSIILKDAADKGVSPLYDADAMIIADVSTLPPERLHRGPELQ